MGDLLVEIWADAGGIGQHRIGADETLYILCFFQRVRQPPIILTAMIFFNRVGNFSSVNLLAIGSAGKNGR
jgi:hypothetical protein